MANCLFCEKEVFGRSDKLFCSPYCKSAYHYAQNKEHNNTLFNKIDKQLKLNRKLLKRYNLAGKATVRKADFEEAGFNPKYFTHYWKTGKGDVYLFCYEYGFLQRSENNKSKYVLIEWQAYMEK
jgi:hypothetical protein